MGVEVRECPYGAAAHDELRALVRAHQGDDPLRPVTVVVPTNTVGVAVRRRLAGGGRGGGIAAVGVLTHRRLAELLASTHLGAGRRPVTTPVLGAAVRSVLAEDPGAFGRVAGHPSTTEALVGAHRTLAELWSGTQGQEPDAISRLAGRPRQLSREVVRVHRAVHRRLADGWYDEADLVDAALRAVEANTALLTDLGLVVLFLPQELAPGQAALVSGLGRRVQVVVLAGLTGQSEADGPVRRSLARWSSPPSARDLPPMAPAPVELLGNVRCSPQDTVVFTASDADDEVRNGVRHLVAAIGEGVPLERAAVLYATPEPYAALVHEHLVAAGISWNGAAARPLGDRLLARALLRLLALPDRGFRLHDVCGWMADAPILNTDGRRAPASAWAAVARSAGVVDGEDWDQRLRGHADRLRDGAAQRHPEDPRLSSRWPEVERTEALRAFVHGLRRDLAADPGGWNARVDWIKGLVHRYLGGDAYRASHWRSGEAAAGEKVEAALDRLADLDPVEPHADLATFRAALELELDADLGRTGKLGQGVVVGPVSSALGLVLDVVVVVGLAEGMYPAAVNDDPLLPADELSSVGAELPSATDRVHRQHRHLLAVMAASRRLVLGAPRGDLRRTTELVPSRWLLDIAGQLSGAGRRLASDALAVLAPTPWLQRVPSFAGGIAEIHMDSQDRNVDPAAPGQLALGLEPSLGLPAATEQEVRLRALPARGSALGLPLIVADPTISAGLRLQQARHSGRFTEFDGDLSGLPIPRPSDGSLVSPTQLEEWVRCPHRYFMHRLLGVQEVEDPDDVLELSPLHRGSLVHRVLELFVLQVLDRSAEQRLEPEHPWTEDDVQQLKAAFRTACEEFADQDRVGPELLWAREQRRTWRELYRFLGHDQGRRLATSSYPVAAELRFGFDDSPVGAVELELPDGRTVAFRGSIDRLDRRRDGSLLVVDYKTGKPDKFRVITQDDPTATAAKLQLPVYALAAQGWAAATGQHTEAATTTPVRSDYWFTVSKKELELIGVDADKAVLDRFAEVVAGIDQQIGAGTFPARPNESWGQWVDCAYCDPDGLGTAEGRRAWERKRSDTALVTYLALVEPADPKDPDA